MLSLNATQQAIVASDYKLVSWLFDVTTIAPVSYYWSIKDKNYGGHDYTYKVSDFDNITLKKSNSEYGIQSPNDLIFTIVNKDNTLNADDFVDAYVLLRLVVSDGTDEEVIRTWKFKIKQSEPHNQTIKFTCVDFAQEYLEGDYPNTKLIRDISPSDDGVPDDTLCVPLPFGTCYIPLRSIYITDARYYVLGLASHTYTITKVRSPREWGNTSEWDSGSYTFTQSTKTIDGVNWRVFQPIIADSNNDGTCDACGLWKSGDVFLDPLVQFSRNDTTSMTSPADIIEFVLKDMGVASGDIDATTFGAAKTTYTSWGLTLEGAFFYKMPREKALALLLNMCHSMFIPREKLELHVLSKTSQWTLNKSHILQRGRGESSFDYNLLTQEKSDSGYIGYQVVDMPQDNLVKAIVPAKATTDEILNETLDVSWINDSQDAQRAGSLYYQRKLLKKSNIHFDSKGTLLALDQDDMITIDHADYGGTYDILINTITINRDAVMSFKGIRYSDDMDDWDDLTPGAINIATDDSGNVWASVTYGPSSSVSSGDNPNQIGDGFFAGKTDLWGGNVALNNAATKIVLGDLDATPKIALGASADAITHAGTEQGFFADGDGKVRFGDADGYVKFTPGSPSTFDIKGVLTASEIHIPDQDTTANSFHVQSDADTWWGCTETNFNADNDNATAYILKNGVAKFQNVILDSSVTISDIQAGSEIAIQGWQHDIVFSSTDANTVSWASGTITLMSGATYNISAGNTGNMAARTYIYLDIGTSSTVLQMTTTASTAVGSGKILIGVAQNSTQQATFQIFGGIGGLTITGGDIENLSITAGEIATDAIETAKLAADAVTAAKIAVSGLDGTSGDVATNHIIAGMLQANCVTSVKVLADAITAAKIAVSGLDGTSGDVATNHIIAGMLQANCVTSVKILADAVTAAKINVVGLDGTSGRIVVADATDANVVTGGINSHAVTLINAGKILVSGATVLSDWSHASDATLIDGGDIYTNSVTATQIAANTITAAEIFAGTIGTTEIAADAVTATKINVVGLNGTSGRIVVADATDANVVTGGINSHAVTLINAGKILISGAAVLSDWSHATDATLIDGGEIYTNSVTASQIAANTITANEIAANTITAGEIAAGTITLSEINYVPFVPATDDLDDISDGTSYGRVALTSITAGQIILTAGVTGSLPVANSDAKCTDANADQTSANTAANAAAYTGASIATGYTDADVTDYADYRVSNSQLENTVTTISNPQGGTYSGGYNDTGAIVIILPQSWTNTMLKFEVDVFNYSASKSFKALVGGYTEISTSSWRNEFAQIIGNTQGSNRVRFGHDGTKCCVVIGETSTVWDYPKIAVRNFQGGFNNCSIAQWDDGWSISTETDISGITFTGDFSDALLDSAAILNQGVLATEDDLDGVPNGTNYSKVATTSITAGQIILTAGVTGSLPVANSDAKCTDANADQTSANTAANAAAYTGAAIGTTYTAAKCTDANADQTSANNQAVAWLTDAGNLATLNTVNATYIDAGSITLVKCAAETTNRQFTSDANRTNIEAWRHASDATLIDGGDIYANSISVDKITSSFNPNLIPSRFADFERFDNGDTIAAYNGNATITNIGSFIGEQCLNMTATAADNHIYLGKSTTDYNMRLQPSTKYLISLYATTGSGTPEIQVYIKQDDGVLKGGSVQDITTSWARYTFIITTDSNLTDSGILRLDNNDNGAVIYIDGIQIEKANAAASPEASRWTPGTLHGSQFGNLTITAGKLAINTTDALEIQAAGNVLVKQGGDIVMEGGASGNPSLVRFKDETVPGEIRWEQSGNSAKYWQFIKLAANDQMFIRPYGLTAPYFSVGESTNRVGAFYVHSTSACRFYVGSTVNSLAIYNASIETHVNLNPNGHKTLDLGAATKAWDTAYADDFTNVADFYQFDDRDDLAVINQITGSGIVDPLTGYELIDDNTLPAWLLKKHNKDGEVRDEDDNIITTYKRGDDCRDPDGKPYLSLKTMISLCMGAIREINNKVEAMKP